MVLMVGSMNMMVGVWGSWSASTIIDIAAEFLDPSDGQSLQSNADPLVDSITNNDHHHHHKPKVVKVHSNEEDNDERFLVPMLSNSVGDNNQFMEYMAAVVMARATNRTLCLTPFFNGPTKHTGHLQMGSLSFKDRYDTNELSKFVELSSLQRCLHKCHKNIHGFWWFRHSSSSSLSRDWTWDPNVNTHEFGKDFVNWTSVDHVRQAIEGFNDGSERCVALGGLFPGLRWRGAYLAPSLYMRPSQSILKLANTLQTLAIGQDHNFLAVHWRFEESLCKANELGLCFLRCGDGAVISSGLHATTRGLPIAAQRGREQMGSSCKRMVDSTWVKLSKEDLVSAIIDKALKENVSFVYIATDGWMRGSHAHNLIREVVKEVRGRGLAVSGLWKISNVPNIIVNGSDYMFNNQIMEILSNNKLSGHSISMMEQELCFRASSFMGSGESTWSLAVFRARLASRRWRQLVQFEKVEEGKEDVVLESLIDDNYIIKELLHDYHAAGLQCRYKFLYKPARLSEKVPEESYQDEAPDTWLDMEACEAQLGRGGSCKLFDCFP
ncbi:hypothetical protein GOP47_0016699 [Adiantum capillus-veneris]|uniref:O-fucosyltransferase family protein n=1 Tax=Adiantum capillus-veneris TaxID=13818 RepID=A0A9D4UIZ1_ADICA|nr:hypothetical protein GOP47_0016699 [Adiantum capillus-veneris]